MLTCNESKQFRWLNALELLINVLCYSTCNIHNIICIVDEVSTY